LTSYGKYEQGARLNEIIDFVHATISIRYERRRAVTVYQHPHDDALPAASPVPPGRGQWNWQRLVQRSCIVLALLLLVIFVVNLPALFEYARTICTLPDVGNCPTEQLTPAYVQVLDQLHLSVAVAEDFLAVLCVVVSMLYWLLGLLIFWRKSQEWIGLLVSLLFVLVGSTCFLGFNLPTQTPPPFQLLAEVIVYGLMWPAMLLFFFIFPTGRFTPRWTLAAFVPFFVVTMLSSLHVTSPFIPGVVVILITLVPIVVQVYRYARIYDAVQQQQIKWFVFGLSSVFLLVIIQGILQAVAPVSSAAKAWYQLFNGPFWLVPWTIVLLSVSIPILRYRLWDIDVLINRTLVYGVLTVILTAFYVGLIIGLQALLRGIISQDNSVAIILSTLAIYGLFQPLRRRIQRVIDRRFYRSKYAAAKTLAAFSATLRNEVDLEQLREQLLGVVEETMQPAHVSLWLRPPEPTRKQQTWLQVRIDEDEKVEL
jgi:hypothetical protein